jgi:hypothetical protein
MPWKYVPAAFVMVAQTAAGVSAFALARRLLSERAALFAAVCYAANPYALLMIYFRSDYAELLAAAFFPLLILTALQFAGILSTANSSSARAVVAFAATFAAVWLSNAPAGVLATYSAVLLFAWAAVTQKSLRPLGSGATALALGFGLAAFYIVPAAYEQRWVNIGEALSSTLVPRANFLYTVMRDREHTFFNWLASSIAVGMAVMTGFAAIGGRSKNGEQKNGLGEKERTWRAMLILAAAATVLMLRPTLFLWEILPKLRFLQFPWRWMGILAVPFAYLLATAVARRHFALVWIAATIAVLSATAAFLVHEAWWDPQDIPALQAAVAKGEGFDGTDEYDPVGDDHYNLPPRAPRVRILPGDGDSTRLAQANVFVEKWTAEDKRVRVAARAPVRLELRVLNYPAWRVEVNGAKVAPGRAEDSNQMIVSVPAGESRVSVRFTRTLDRTVGVIVSSLSLLIAFILFGLQWSTSPVLLNTSAFMAERLVPR